MGRDLGEVEDDRGPELDVGGEDPVGAAGVEFREGRTEPQAQSLTDTPDHEVTRSCEGDGPLPAPASSATDTAEGTELKLGPGALVLHLNRVLQAGPSGLPSSVKGQVTGHWTLPDGTRAHGVFAVLR
ncbi:hypothetical protein [Streptomyces scabiei]|uniref:hypothetical protein n=1 Tax=Streptomyces scabiei TaxID=1930 RepID=UPI000A7533FE|nr:hypothetical protein [Streptomyces scabiei]